MLQLWLLEIGEGQWYWLSLKRLTPLSCSSRGRSHYLGLAGLQLAELLKLGRKVIQSDSKECIEAAQGQSQSIAWRVNCCIKEAKLIACNIPICIFHQVNRNGNKAPHVLAGWYPKFFFAWSFILSLVQRILWKYILRNCDLCLLQSVPSCISLWLKYFLLII